MIFPNRFVVLSLFVLLFPDPALGQERFEYERPKMGMPVRIVLYADNAETARAAVEAAFRRFDAINESMSDYDTESEIVRLAKSAEKDGEPVWRPVSDDLFAVLTEAATYSKLSGGAFDVTVAPLSKLWRRARRLRAFPEKHLLEQARAKVGYEAIELDAGRKAVRLTRPGMRLDLGGIAK
ncbi:MAG TPA: hypothetical protein DEB39_05075, partial [Planctomycetaceae bacterium]|nr:hypothetical protein [Planctomycetaceae bacterium]